MWQALAGSLTQGTVQITCESPGRDENDLFQERKGECLVGDQWEGEWQKDIDSRSEYD
jgi:hypothetical protein